LWGYFHFTRRNLERITEFIKDENADIVGLVEVDAGSYRASRKNQAQLIAQKLGHYHSYACKYASGHAANLIPVLNQQGNAFLTRDSFSYEKFHYFDRGVKRLVIELELDELTVFLVHLSLTSRIRHRQLNDLYGLVKETSKPHIVAGDFNALWGDREIQLFLAATELTSANLHGKPSFPSWKPKRQLDFVLHSKEIEITDFHVPDVKYSDHLPLVCDFRVKPQ
jgi:endonuclease/exonuclease/phosphatase family metal-dependent hydrolase